MDCNAATRNVPPWFCGGGVSGIPAAVRRDVHCRSSGCPLPFVGMSTAVRRDACCRLSGCLERGVLMPCTI